MSPFDRNTPQRTCIWYAHDLQDGDVFSRLTKTVDDGTNPPETTLYLGGDIELADDGTWTKHIGQNFRRVGSVTTWLHRDHLASVRAVSDSTGVLTNRSAYAPYGEREDTVRRARGHRLDRDPLLQGLYRRAR